MAKILLIDDDQFETDLLRLRLSDAGHDVQVAEDGLNGPIRAAALQPDVIFLDFNMPAASGGQVLARLRANPKTKPIPVIIITGMAEGELVFEGGLKPDAYLQKPLDFQVMLKHVARLTAPPPAPSSRAAGPADDGPLEIS